MNKKCIVSIVITFALMIMSISCKSEKAKEEDCANNLTNLYKGVCTYIALFGGARSSTPLDGTGEIKGSELWVKLCTDPTDVLEQDNAGKDAEILRCPVKGDGNGPDYRGPRNGWSKARKYLACDNDGNHKKGGYALTKSGTVVKLEGEEWLEALEETVK
ncbi:MAG: hypothetical protein A2W23_04185 [Planctomycetes bacterium RBG_16_43_13]|nr:MAG: hypothetical protein A2W23_04185 [Planctomycetes bacterium RBG_16_43_13]